MIFAFFAHFVHGIDQGAHKMNDVSVLGDLHMYNSSKTSTFQT